MFLFGLIITNAFPQNAQQDDSSECETINEQHFLDAQPLE